MRALLLDVESNDRDMKLDFELHMYACRCTFLPATDAVVGKIPTYDIKLEGIGFLSSPLYSIPLRVVNAKKHSEHSGKLNFVPRWVAYQNTTT